ncbi:MAG: 50S ribosomal protein L25 [Deltaproteobacteria bacterium]|nr:MAG: 50S ribosomal protein L25 [Deltaproteobacteria bacterium]
MELNARIRTETGKGPARRLRSVGRLPAIFYGPEINPIMLSIDYPQLRRIIEGRSAENIILDLTIDSDGESQSKKVMIKEIQRDPVTRDYLHIDLIEIAMGKEIEVDIPVHLINTPVGVREGGILEHIRRRLRVSCMPEDMVDKIDVDVSDLDIGQSVHIGDVSLPPGLRSTEDESLPIAIVVAPTTTAEEEEVVEEEEVEEPESEEIKGEEES